MLCYDSMRSAIAAVLVTSMTGLALAQTQPTRPSAYATMPTLPSALATAPLSPCYGNRWVSFNLSSPCFSGTPYPSYSAVGPLELPKSTNPAAALGSASLDADQAKQRIEAKGYQNVSGLMQDLRKIWRGQASMKDGSPVNVILDLEGNVYSEPSSLFIRIERAPLRKNNF